MSDFAFSPIMVQYLQTVILIHLSHDNSDREEMVETVSSVSGLPTYTAYPGMVVNLDKNPY